MKIVLIFRSSVAYLSNTYIGDIQKWKIMINNMAVITFPNNCLEIDSFQTMFPHLSYKHNTKYIIFFDKIILNQCYSKYTKQKFIVNWKKKRRKFTNVYTSLGIKAFKNIENL